MDHVADTLEMRTARGGVVAGSIHDMAENNTVDVVINGAYDLQYPQIYYGAKELGEGGDCNAAVDSQGFKLIGLCNSRCIGSCAVQCSTLPALVGAVAKSDGPTTFIVNASSSSSVRDSTSFRCKPLDSPR